MMPRSGLPDAGAAALWITRRPEPSRLCRSCRSAVYLTFADAATRTDARNLVGGTVTVKGTLTLGVLEKRGANRPEGDAVVAAPQIPPAK
jgi:hypothetical protein